jgi:hypothetical protein
MNQPRSKTSRRPRAEGGVVEINLPDGRFAYAQILSDPLVGFFSGCHEERQSVEMFRGRAFEFCLWVHHDAFRSDRWRGIGKISVPEILPKPWFFKQDALSKALSLYQHETGAVREVSVDELSRYEAAAVWDPEQVEQRLLDQCEGRANIFVKSMLDRAAAAWMSKFGS